MATGFPAGQTPLKTRLEEIRLAVADGAREIDIVINRQLALIGDWKGSCLSALLLNVPLCPALLLNVPVNSHHHIEP